MGSSSCRRLPALSSGVAAWFLVAGRIRAPGRHLAVGRGGADTRSAVAASRWLRTGVHPSSPRGCGQRAVTRPGLSARRLRTIEARYAAVGRQPHRRARSQDGLRSRNRSHLSSRRESGLSPSIGRCARSREGAPQDEGFPAEARRPTLEVAQGTRWARSATCSSVRRVARWCPIARSKASRAAPAPARSGCLPPEHAGRSGQPAASSSTCSSTSGENHVEAGVGGRVHSGEPGSKAGAPSATAAAGRGPSPGRAQAEPRALAAVPEKASRRTETRTDLRTSPIR